MLFYSYLKKKNWDVTGKTLEANYFKITWNLNSLEFEKSPEVLKLTIPIMLLDSIERLRFC